MSARPSSNRQPSGKAPGFAAASSKLPIDGINGVAAPAASTAASAHLSTGASHPLQSPCFVHSYLDSGLGLFRNNHDTSYFDAGHHQQSLPAAALQHQRNSALSHTNENHPSDPQNGSSAQSQTSASTASSTVSSDGLSSADKRAAAASTSGSASGSRQRRHSTRPQPMYRGMRGAVEPDSDNEDGSGSGTSESGSSSHGESDSYISSGDEETRVRSLTRQLAETAVGVREMSKQLGRARVKSRIQSVLIITKARDNHLIKLTRELAIWLMTTPRNDRELGLTVYVDSQLRQSKRFDAEGIRRDYPQLFASPPSTSTLRRTGGADGNASHSSGSNDSNTANDSSNSTDTTDYGNKSGLDNTNDSRKASTSNGRANGEESLLRYWTSDMCSRSPHLFDFVVTLGGDGTVLFCSWLFQRIVPPVMPFALGSLGFLTNFDFKNYQKYLKSALDTGIRVNLRMRFTATVYRVTHPINSTLDKRRRRAIKSGKTGEIIMKNLREGGWESIEKPLPQNSDLRGAYTEGIRGDDADDEAAATERPRKDKEIMCFSTRPVETFEVLNDLVVDRGPSPYVSLLEVFGDEHHLTTAQADGLCISTPTGSTAYSLSAGGSLVHPEIPAILISPICPHTLSFRPMLLPDSMELRIAVPYNSRSTAWASFDGRGRVELKQGDHIKVTASKYPFPTVCADNQSTDWFESISRTLKWNERQRQKSFVVVEEGEERDEHDERVEKTNKKEGMRSEAAEAKTGGDNSMGSRVSSNEEERTRNDKHDEAGNEVAGEDEDEADEDGEEDEKFDIDDSSTVVTRTNSPDPSLRRRHSTTSDGRNHHHHHHNHGRARSSNGASTPNLSSSTGNVSLPFSSLKPMTRLNSQASDNATQAGREQQQPSPSASKVSFGERQTPLTVSSGVGRYQHGVVDPSSRSLLDSPDRFGSAGPPDPPRALSERHLATADFRLDESHDPDQHESSSGMLQHENQHTGDGAAGNTTSSSGGKQEAGASSGRADPGIEQCADDDASSHIQAPQLRESILNVAESNAKIASGSNKLYRKLKGRSSSRARRRDSGGSGNRQRSSGDGGDGLNGGFELGRTDSRKSTGGAALVVYGQDESDSESTAEG